MNDTTYIVQLLKMPETDFDRYFTAVKQIAALRQMPPGEFAPTLDPSPAPATGVHSPSRPPLRQRTPMRPPKPTSLRGAVHELLRAADRPLRRAEIISQIAFRRGERVTECMKTKIGDVLTNRHDPLIRRIGHGVYTYATAQ